MSKKMKEADSEEEIKEAFKLVDMDGDGFISASEFKQVMDILGKRFSEEEVDEFLRELEIDGDGRISYEGKSLHFSTGSFIEEFQYFSLNEEKLIILDNSYY